MMILSHVSRVILEIVEFGIDRDLNMLEVKPYKEIYSYPLLTNFGMAL